MEILRSAHVSLLAWHFPTSLRLLQALLVLMPSKGACDLSTLTITSAPIPWGCTLIYCTLPMSRAVGPHDCRGHVYSMVSIVKKSHFLGGNYSYSSRFTLEMVFLL